MATPTPLNQEIKNELKRKKKKKDQVEYRSQDIVVFTKLLEISVQFVTKNRHVEALPTRPPADNNNSFPSKLPKHALIMPSRAN